MSGSALIRAIVLLIIGSVFLYWGIFDTHMMHERAANLPPISEGRSRLTELGLGLSLVLFGLWIIRRQVRNAPPFSGFGTSGKVLLGFAGVVALAAVGYGFWHNAHQTYVSPTRHIQPANPANAAAPSPAPRPAGVPGSEPASAPGSLPAAVPQAGGPTPAPAPLPPAGE